MKRRVLALTLLALLAVASAAGAVPIPDSTLLVSLQQRIDVADASRLVTHKAMFDLSRPRLGPDGVRLRTEHHSALVSLDDTGEKGRLIPWSDVEQLRVCRYHIGRSSVIGFLAGAALGGLALSHGPDLFEKGDNGAVAWAAVLTVGGTGAGLLTGYMFPESRSIYP